MKKMLATAIVATFLGLGAAYSATVPFVIDFGATPAGFTVSGATVNNGNCPFGTARCSLANDNDTLTVTNSTSLFTVASATFRFQGSASGNGVLFEALKFGVVVGKALFKIGASSGFGDGSLSAGSVPIEDKVDYEVMFDGDFAGIDTFMITSDKQGKKAANLRVDTFKGTVAAVPLPAGGLLLLGALGILGAARRSRKAA